jgi:hypothetical protein
MKNSFKVSLLALAVATSFSACKGKGSASTDSVTKADSVTKTVTDTTKKDTSAMPDSLKKDTTIKTTTTKTTSKMSVSKKKD